MSDITPTEASVPEEPKPVTIAVSSQTLFDMTAEMKIYKEEGVQKYVSYQVEHQQEPLKKGPAFPFIKVLMNVNSQLRELYPDSEELFDILVTDNHAGVGERVKNSINHYKLDRVRFYLTRGNNSIGYLKAERTKLYLSSADEVKEAIKEGIAAATIFPPAKEMEMELSDTQLRVVFDGDGVLFSNESQIIFDNGGLDAFKANEKMFENQPMAPGPLKCFLEELVKLQRKFYARKEHCPIRTFLVTARGTNSAGVRVLKTLQSWSLEVDEARVDEAMVDEAMVDEAMVDEAMVDEAMFLAGAPKTPVLQQIKPHIFFDDQMGHIERAQEGGITSAHVPI